MHLVVTEILVYTHRIIHSVTHIECLIFIAEHHHLIFIAEHHLLIHLTTLSGFACASGH